MELKCLCLKGWQSIRTEVLKKLEKESKKTAIGDRLFLTPEVSMQIQTVLNNDIGRRRTNQALERRFGAI